MQGTRQTASPRAIGHSAAAAAAAAASAVNEKHDLSSSSHLLSSEAIGRRTGGHV